MPTITLFPICRKQSNSHPRNTTLKSHLGTVDSLKYNISGCWKPFLSFNVEVTEGVHCHWYFLPLDVWQDLTSSVKFSYGQRHVSKCSMCYHWVKTLRACTRFTLYPFSLCHSKKWKFQEGGYYISLGWHSAGPSGSFALCIKIERSNLCCFQPQSLGIVYYLINLEVGS